MNKEERTKHAAQWLRKFADRIEKEGWEIIRLDVNHEMIEVADPITHIIDYEPTGHHTLTIDWKTVRK